MADSSPSSARKAAAVQKGETVKENALPHTKGFAVGGGDEVCLQRKIRDYRNKIASYSGNDPIAPRYDFLSWLETHYPCKEKNKGLFYDEVVEFCRLVDTPPFNTEAAKNDPRYVQIWLTYANLSGEPSKTYEFMKKASIGVRDAQFYKEWAWEMEKLKKFNQAQAVFKAGIDNMAYPVDDIKEAFSAFVSRRMTCRDDEDEENAEDGRQVFAQLKPIGKQHVRAPVERVGLNVLGSAGVLQTGTASNIGNARWEVKDDVENFDPEASDALEASNDLRVDFNELLRREENTVEKIAFEHKVKLPGRRVGPKVAISSLRDKSVGFTIFCDESDEGACASSAPKPADPFESGKIRGPESSHENAGLNLSASKRDLEKMFLKPDGSTDYYISRLAGVSQEERLAAAFKHSQLTKVPLNASRSYFANASNYEVGLWTWNCSRDLTQSELPPGSKLIVPPEVFTDDDSLEEVLLKKREEARIKSHKGEKRKHSERTTLCDEEHAKIAVHDPFSSQVRAHILKNFGKLSSVAYAWVDENLPNIRLKGKFVSEATEDEYVIEKIVGEGSYAKVFRALVSKRGKSVALDQTMIPMEDEVVFKVQKPACPWELYICSEIHRRLRSSSASYSIRRSIVKVSKAYIFKDGSLLVSNFEAWGSLLTAVNHYAEFHRAMPEPLVFCYTYDILHIVEKVHQCGIIHGDIKVDNFLLSDVPSVNKAGVTEEEVFGEEGRCLQLIDFGRAIDLTALPEEIKFKFVSSVEYFKTPEMREGRPWTHHIDFFGIASTVHVMLFGKHMEVAKDGGKWYPTGVHFRRPIQGEFWKKFFETLLNLPEGGELPKLAAIRQDLFKWFISSEQMNKVEKYSSELRGFLNSN